MATRQTAGIAKRKIPPEEEANVVQAYKEGASLASIASHYACSEIAVSKTLRRLAVPLRNRGAQPLYTRNSEFVARVLALHAEGSSARRIAETLGSGPDAVSQVLRSRGITSKATRERHPNWKGGRILNPHGYYTVLIPHDHPMAEMRLSNGYVLEHRLVVAESIGRPLTPRETVHHINGDRTDNRIENLQLRQGKHGKNSVFCCGDCGSFNIVSMPLKE